MSKRINSRAKGKEAEQELARVLRSLGFPDARRTQQYSGTEGTSDITGIAGLHIECKHSKKVTMAFLLKWMQQAIRDATDDVIPVVMFKKNRGEWMLMYRVGDVAEVAIALRDARAGKWRDYEVIHFHHGDQIGETLIRLPLRAVGWEFGTDDWTGTGAKEPLGKMTPTGQVK